MNTHAHTRPRSALLSLILAVSLVLTALAVPQLLSARANADSGLKSGETKTLGCAGRSLTMSRVDADSATFLCAAAKVVRVGGAMRFASTKATKATTALPKGTAPGTLLVSTVESSGTTVRFPSGWTRAYDKSVDGVRLAAWWKIARAGEKKPTAILGHATQVTMMTVAFHGVVSRKPLKGAAAAPGVVSPVVSPVVGGVVVLSQGSGAAKGRAKAPRGAAWSLSISNGGNAQVALATTTGPVSATSSRTWTLNPTSPSIAGSVSVPPSPPAPLAVGATSVTPGKSWKVRCAGQPLVAARVNATTVKVTCTAPASSSASSASSTASSPSDSQSSDPAPTGPSSDPSSSSPDPSSSSPDPSSSSPDPSSSSPASSSPATGTGAPATPPAAICGTSVLNGPSTPPAGAVTVTPSQNLGDVTDNAKAGTTFWLAPGTYHLGTGAYDQVQPQNGDVFIGAPGAIIDGQHKNLYAFVGKATNVTIKYLTIQNFGAAGDNNNEGVVNHDAATGWTMAYNTIQNDAGAGVFLGNSDTVSYNCLRNNGQYGFSSYLPDGVHNLVLDHNEISGNNTDDWETREPGCGCTGGGKFWDTDGAVVTNNYVHDNHGVGLWADTDNTEFLFQGNYISNNDDIGLMYEISYNAAILDNTFIRNAIPVGPSSGMPSGAIYLSESGSDPRAGSTYGSSFDIAGNVFTDNWSGIIAWENADRFAGSPANSSDGYTTLVNPTVATEKACGTSSLISKAPYFDDCRWKTQNIKVHDNTFNFTPANLGSKCTADNGCGFNGLFSNYGSYPSWSPYKGTVVEDHITFSQHNVWSNNTYHGPWNFMIHELGTQVSWAQWRGTTYGQDAGSSMS